MLKSLSEIKVDVPEGRSGIWRIERFSISKDDAELHNIRSAFSFSVGRGRTIATGEYTRLMRGTGDARSFGTTIVMSDTPAEIRDHSYFVRQATGDVLINGLGLGWVVEALFQKEEVKNITVIEKSLDVCKLVAKHYEDKCPTGKTIRIIEDSAFDYKPPTGKRYNAVWHDIWDNICGDNIEDMKKLHRKYGKRTDWQGSWCRGECERANKGY